MVSRRGILGLLAGLGAASALSGCSVKKVNVPDTQTPSPGKSSASSKPTPTVPAGTALPEGIVNVLVLGSDSRSEDLHQDARADVICLVQLPPGYTRINMVSVPRDTLVTFPNGGRGKINQGYTQGGAQGMAETVSKLLGGIPITYTLETGFTRFDRITDMLGGYEVHNRIASNSSGPNYPAGKIWLRGVESLGYVRERKGLPNGDLDRTERARAALTGMMLRIATLIKENDVAFVEKLKGLWQQVNPGGGVTMDHAIWLMKYAKDLRYESVNSVMVPISGFTMFGGASVNTVNQAKLNEVIAGLRSGDLSPYVMKYGMDTTPQ